MKIERSITFAFKAPGGIPKLVLGGLFSILFFTIFFGIVVMGYLMRVLCDALEGRDAKLPSWGGLGQLFNEGLQPVLLIVAYASPLIALFVIEALLGAFGSSLVLMAILMLVRLLISILLSILIPAALIRFAVKGSLKAAFDFGEILGFIGANKGTYFTAWGLSLAVGVAAGLIATVVGGIIGGAALAVGGLELWVLFTAAGALIFASLFTTFTSTLISMHLYAQAYRSSKPFADDKDGELRASMAIPPPLD
jgi:hypothetical protein